MELTTKYQYTYFIYPYTIRKDSYEKYILKLLNDNKCKLKIFEKEKDVDIYTYFLPYVREYMFPTFEFSKEKIRQLEELKKDNVTRASVLSKMSCTTFEYQIGEDVQGKVEEEGGIFFNIPKVEIFCFNTGVCFFIIKTHLEDGEKFSELLNFNYKFRDINTQYNNLKKFENIRIQTNSFNDIKKLSELIKEITGKNQKNDINNSRFLVYSYSCVDSQDWKDEQDFENLKDEFSKYMYALPEQYNTDFNNDSNIDILSKWKHTRIGITKQGITLLTSSIQADNYTKLPVLYENEYLYTAILALYQKIYLQNLRTEMRENKIIEELSDFIKNIWSKEITNDETGTELYNNYRQILEVNNAYTEIKEKCELLYKHSKFDENKKSNKVLIAILTISLILNVINLVMLFFIKK